MKFLFVLFMPLFCLNSFAENKRCQTGSMSQEMKYYYDSAEKVDCKYGADTRETLNIILLGLKKGEYVRLSRGDLLFSLENYVALSLSGYQTKALMSYVDSGKRFVYLELETLNDGRPVRRTYATYEVLADAPAWAFDASTK